MANLRELRDRIRSVNSTKKITKAQELIAKVVDWDRRTPHAYDPHWINLHGMQAVQASRDPQLAARLTMESLSLPAAQWPSLAEQTRTKYLQGFQEAISQLKAESNTNQPSDTGYSLCTS